MVNTQQPTTEKRGLNTFLAGANFMVAATKFFVRFSGCESNGSRLVLAVATTTTRKIQLLFYVAKATLLCPGALVASFVSATESLTTLVTATILVSVTYSIELISLTQCER